MGCNQCRKKGYQKVNYFAPDEKEIKFKDYSSPNDHLLGEIESKQNFFKYIALYEYINLLDNFTVENSTVRSDFPKKNRFSSSDEFYQKDIAKEEFQSFIENKIFKIDEIYDLTANNLKLRQNYNIDDPIVIKKKNLIPLGLMFCQCNNIEKIKLFFDLFKNENEEFCKSEELNDFLISDFLTGSYCLISARNKIGKMNESIEELKREDLINLVNKAELKDNQNLVKVFNDTFFTKESFNWNEFKQKFEDPENGFGWIFSSKGIRRKLEENNV